MWNHWNHKWTGKLSSKFGCFHWRTGVLPTDSNRGSTREALAGEVQDVSVSSRLNPGCWDDRLTPVPRIYNWIESPWAFNEYNHSQSHAILTTIGQTRICSYIRTQESRQTTWPSRDRALVRLPLSIKSNPGGCANRFPDWLVSTNILSNLRVICRYHRMNTYP